MKIYYSKKFDRAYKKLPTTVRVKAKKREKIFRNDLKDPRLKTHKLQGHLENYWSFSVDRSYRIVFRWVDKNTVLFTQIGDHRVYR